MLNKQLREIFTDTIKEVFFESSDTRFTEEEEIDKYIKEKVNALLKTILKKKG